MKEYKIRTCCFGLFYKVVLFAQSYDRHTISYHLSRQAAEKQVQWLKKTKY
ncbi:hypothetical protein VP249E411_P0170 [Vibrio phage 249E41-1]|nr:hypothetical protein VP249E411_P0170 [Vibrio phage 249E41-1]CAH9017252.1 hypothetical protein VP193E371_P0168 [Vibrio phage 193E37-1]